MDSYLLDNNILNYWFNHAATEHSAVASHIAARVGRRIYTSVIVIGEIEDGHNRIVVPTTAQQTRQNELRGFIQQEFPCPLDLTRGAAEHYGMIRARIFRLCYPVGNGPKRPDDWHWLCPVTARQLGIDENDLWIAAHAAERGLVLVTHDRMAVIRSQVSDLVHIEDWAEPLPAHSPR